MKVILFKLFVWSLLLLCLVGNAQQILLVENMRNLKNYKYYVGDNIQVRLKSEKRVVEGAITCMNNSMLCIGDWESVAFEDIGIIYRERYAVQLSRGILLTLGVGYFSLDFVNRLINHDAPLILAETAVISTSMVGLNFLLIPLRYKRLSTDKWRILQLDFNEFRHYSPEVPVTAPE